jgi:hypothetical protein
MARLKPQDLLINRYRIGEPALPMQRLGKPEPVA